jgi:hypothetical protein
LVLDNPFNYFRNNCVGLFALKCLSSTIYTDNSR